MERGPQTGLEVNRLVFWSRIAASRQWSQ